MRNSSLENSRLKRSVRRTRRPERASALVESDGVEARRRIHGDRRNSLAPQLSARADNHAMGKFRQFQAHVLETQLGYEEDDETGTVFRNPTSVHDEEQAAEDEE